jgi:hypothetical protein
MEHARRQIYDPPAPSDAEDADGSPFALNQNEAFDYEATKVGRPTGHVELTPVAAQPELVADQTQPTADGSLRIKVSNAQRPLNEPENVGLSCSAQASARELTAATGRGSIEEESPERIDSATSVNGHCLWWRLHDPWERFAWLALKLVSSQSELKNLKENIWLKLTPKRRLIALGIVGDHWNKEVRRASVSLLNAKLPTAMLPWWHANEPWDQYCLLLMMVGLLPQPKWLKHLRLTFWRPLVASQKSAAIEQLGQLFEGKVQLLAESQKIEESQSDAGDELWIEFSWLAEQIGRANSIQEMQELRNVWSKYSDDQKVAVCMEAAYLNFRRFQQRLDETLAELNRLVRPKRASSDRNVLKRNGRRGKSSA